MSERISLFIIVFTLANILACLWLLWWTARTRADAQHSASVSTSVSANVSASVPAKTGHVWDGDLEEYNHPLPRWWLGLFIITVLFGVGYLIYFPGLGNFPGTSGWTQVDEHAAEVGKAQALLEQRLAAVKDQPLEVLAADARAMSLAKNLFAANCSLCHGSDGRGAKGFPNLADTDWLWGSAPAAVLTSIAEGRHGMMPALGGVLGEEGLNHVTAYLFSLNGRAAPPDWAAAGKIRFDAVCAACHGTDARGNTQLGAPNLTDDTWLHGGDLESIRATITGGRNSQMPAQLGALGATRVRLLAAYVLNLSAKSRSAGTAARTSARTSARPSKQQLATREGSRDVANN